MRFSLRKTHLTVALAGVASLAALNVGCYGKFCTEFPDRCSGLGGQSSTGTATASTSSTGVMKGCVPDAMSGPTGDPCGVFVDPASGNDSNPGTMAKPKKTLGAGVGAATTGQAVYVCEGTLSDTMGVTLPAGSVVYGGLDCGAGWRVKSATSRSTLAPAAGVIPLTLSTGAGKTEVHHFAASAKAGTTAGSSAIGVVVDNVIADFEDCDVTAGAGVKGADSTTPTDDIGPSSADDASIVGNAGKPADTTTPGTALSGGDAKTNVLCAASVSGAGGAGGTVSGTSVTGAGAGGDGQVAPTPNPNAYGLGGAPQGAGLCSGHEGAPGDVVKDGDGATGTTAVGIISVAGYQGAAGAKGADGNPGQGGGGGGGAKGVAAPATRGASGGGGGAGGCGGKGALGGGAGGSSLGFIVLGAAPAFANVTISVGTGGGGGKGAAGEPGAIGGNGGLKAAGANGSLASCPGGGGGQGSNGGAGGGGHGGHSVGIAYTVSAPSGGFTVTKGTPGNGGATLGMGAAADAGIAANTGKFAGQ